MKYYSPEIEIVHLATNEDILNTSGNYITSENERLVSTPGYWVGVIDNQIPMQ